MRAVQLTDIEAAARVLARLPAAARPRLAAELVMRAHVADKFRKRLGKSHPAYGTGTLVSAASPMAQARRAVSCDVDMLDALAAVITALRDRKTASHGVI